MKSECDVQRNERINTRRYEVQEKGEETRQERQTMDWQAYQCHGSQVASGQRDVRIVLHDQTWMACSLSEVAIDPQVLDIGQWQWFLVCNCDQHGYRLEV